MRSFSHPHILLVLPHSLISEKPATITVFYVIDIKKSHLHSTHLIGPPCLFDFGHFSYLHIITTLRLLETSEPQTSDQNIGGIGTSCKNLTLTKQKLSSFEFFLSRKCLLFKSLPRQRSRSQFQSYFILSPAMSYL